MTEERNGGPAFPGRPQHTTSEDLHEGMSLRDWFAGQALQGIAAYERGRGYLWLDMDPATLRQSAELAWRLADAMLVARAPRPSVQQERAAGADSEVADDILREVADDILRMAAPLKFTRRKRKKGQ